MDFDPSALDIGNIDLDGMVATIKGFFWNLFKIPFEMFNSLPEPVKIGVYCLFWAFCGIVAISVWKNRDEWQNVYH